MKMTILEEKHQKRKAYLSNISSVSSKTAYSNICKTVQTMLRDSWLSKEAGEFQSFVDRKDIKKLFDTLKTVYGPQTQEQPHSLVQMELVF